MQLGANPNNEKLKKQIEDLEQSPTEKSVKTKLESKIPKTAEPTEATEVLEDNKFEKKN